MASAGRQEATPLRSFRNRVETVVNLEEGGIEEYPLKRLERECALAQEKCKS